MDTIQTHLRNFFEEAERTELAARAIRHEAFLLEQYVRNLPNLLMEGEIKTPATARRMAIECAILGYLFKLKTGSAKQSGILSRAFANWTFEDVPPPEDIRNYLYRMRDRGLIQQCPLGRWSLTDVAMRLFQYDFH
nr:hypothetical protein [uncultured Hyphomonas sp.]